MFLSYLIKKNKQKNQQTKTSILTSKVRQILQQMTSELARDDLETKLFRENMTQDPLEYMRTQMQKL